MPPQLHPLSEEYYHWEQLGRGELLWDRYVQPEPYFHPFERHGNFYGKSKQPIIDDGYIPSRWTRLRDKVFAPKATPPPLPHNPLAYLDNREAPEACHDHRDELVEIVLHIPREQKLNESAFEYFLYALSPAQSPICFEIVATSELITIQLVVDLSDQSLVKDCLQSYLPEVHIEIREPILPDLIYKHRANHIISRELALEREFVFPIRQLKGFGVDPYQPILTSLSNLKEGELAIIQFNFQSCVNPWAKNLWRLVTQNDQTTPFFDGGSHYLRAVEVKNQKPHVAMVVRFAALAPTEDESRNVARRMASAFQNYEDENAFVLADDDDTEPTTRMVELALRRFRRSGMILNMEEFLALVHLPGADVYAPRLLRLEEASVIEPPEQVIRNNGHTLGTSLYNNQRTEVTISDTDRLSHCHIIGASGSGKSTHLLHSILQDIDKGIGVAVLDPHGDLSEAVLNRIPEQRLKDVVLFDPGDEDYPVGFNILNAKSDIEKNMLESDLVSIFQRLATSWGDQMTTVLANATMAFLESEEGGTLSDLRRFLVDKSYRDSFVKTVEDPDVRLFWQDEFNLLKGNTTASLTGRLNTFMRTKVLRNMVVQKNDKLDFRDIMDSGKIFLAPLSMGLIGEENTKLLGSLLVSKFYQTALTRQDVPEHQRAPFFLYLDEAAHFATSSLATVLTGTRKYGMGLILAHHYLNQYSQQSADVLSALLANAHTRICFKVEDQDARRMASAFDGFDESTLRQLTVGKAVCRIGPSNHSFALDILHPDLLPDADPEKAIVARKFSREKYARPKTEIEADYAQHVEQRIAARKPKKTIRQQAEEKVERLAVNPKAGQKPSLPSKSKQHIKPQSESEESVTETDTNEPVAEIDKKEEELSKTIVPTDHAQESDTVSAPDQIASESVISTEKLKGRGSPAHKALQQRIEKLAIGFGLGAVVESHLPDKRRIDVFVSGQGIRIAFEVALRNDSSYEVENIRKGLDHKMKVIVVSDDESHLETIRSKAISDGLITQSSENVQFIHQDQVAKCFDGITRDLPDESPTIHGLHVERSVPSGSDTEAKMDELYRMFGKDHKQAKDPE